MKSSQDLRLQIPLTPSQLSFIPSVIEKMNAEPEMLMGRLTLRENVLEIDCHDAVDLIENMSSKNQIEVARLRRQIGASLGEALFSSGISDHQRKNFLILKQAIEMA